MNFFNKISLLGLAWVSFALTAVSQPCDNGISTNPYNPVNNQFVPLANQWYPTNGTDTHNPWLNQWSWYWSDGNPTIYRDNLNWDHQWPGNAPSVAMVHPYDILMPEGFEYLRPAGVHPDFYDYRWEDGWELLWMNMGYYPDGHAINDPAVGSYYDNHNWDYEPLPSNAPYFAIYNRYRGILRLFANVWYSAESTFEDIDVVLKFTDFSGLDNELTGLLRHASAYDRALSEPTEIKSIHAPRFHAPDLTQWIVVDFQIGYDPCSCMSTGELIFDFNAFSTLDVDIVGRSIALDVPINDTTYTTRDFLNMSEVNVGEYVPGTEIYQNMDRLAEQFEKKQLQYLEELEAYNQSSPFAIALQKFGVKQAAKYLSGGLANILISDSLLTWVSNDNWQDATSLEDLTIGIDPVLVKNKFADKAKGLFGETFGFLAAELFKPVEVTKPSPPAVPVATLEESVYKGTIVNTATRPSAPMIIPGSIPQAWEPGTPLSPHRLPVYNEVLGQVALLNIPETEFYYDSSTDYETLYETDPFFQNDSCYSKQRTITTTSLKMRLNDLDFALNPSLDFDMEKTKTYARVEVELANQEPREELMEATLHYSQFEQASLDEYSFTYQFPGSPGPGEVTHSINSDWIALEELNQYEFSFLRIDSIVNHKFGLYNLDPVIECQYQYQPNYSAYQFEMDIASIKIKVMHDFYFDQIGTSDDQVNVLQVYTYRLYDSEASINNLNVEQSSWSDTPLSGTFDQYLPGTITLGNETITTSHPSVNEVIGNEIFINAEEVLVNGPLHVQSGYTLVIQALEQIHQTIDAVFNPKIQMRIKKDFYDTPVFDYADNTQIESFCNSTFYQANVDAASISVGPPNQEGPDEFFSSQQSLERGSVSLFPNPAHDLLTLRSSHLDMSSITIHDLSGRPIKQETLQSNSRETQINLLGIAPGTYIVRVDCGDEVFSEKLVVTK
jgi:hypothetical protein